MSLSEFMFTGFGFDIPQFIGIICAILFFTMEYKKFLAQKKQELEAENRKVYQELELASIDLFRFENDNPVLHHQLWFQDHLPKTEFAKARLKNYTCQILNLFEIAFRHHQHGVMPHEVLDSWLIWQKELCEAKNFQNQWAEIRFNYILEFRKTIDMAIQSINPEINFDDRPSPQLLNFKKVFTDSVKQKAS
jgi:hypothetical protein